MNFRELIFPAILTGIAAQLVRMANEQYEPLRDNYGIELVLGIVGLALVLLLIAVKLVSKALSNKRAIDRTIYVASGSGPMIGRVVGTGFGITCCLALFIAGTAFYVDTTVARDVTIQSRRLAIALSSLSVLSGLIALVLPRRGFGGVFIYFIAGFVFTFAIYKFLNVSLYEWPSFTNYIGWVG